MLVLKLLLYLVKNVLKTCFPTFSKGKKIRRVMKFKKLFEEKDEARKYLIYEFCQEEGETIVLVWQYLSTSATFDLYRCTCYEYTYFRFKSDSMCHIKEVMFYEKDFAESVINQL
jgi:hypothetical protein